uniref:Uncharacterized protein n=1 Tax=Romanomermis culicivorax TaxID=13658 RepID=A0A915HTF6_ROMCU
MTDRKWKNAENKGFGMSREDLKDRMFFLKPGETKILRIKVLTPVSGKFKYRIEYIGLGAAKIVDDSLPSVRDVFAKFWRSRWNTHNVEIDVVPN